MEAAWKINIWPTILDYSDPRGDGHCHDEEHWLHTEDDVLRQLDAIVQEIVGHPVDPDANYFTAGLDSLAVTKLHTLLTRRLEVTLPVMALFRRPTLRATAAAVVARRAADQAAPQRQQHGDGHSAAAVPDAHVPAPRPPEPARPSGAAASRREIRERIRRGEDSR